MDAKRIHRILPLVASLLVLSCQQDSATGVEDDSHAVGARISSGGVPSAIWASTDSVHLTFATTGTAVVLLDTGLSLSGKTGICTLKTVRVSNDQGVSMTADGFVTGTKIWSGSAEATATGADTTLVVVAVLAAPSGVTVAAPAIESLDATEWAADTFDQPVHAFLSSATSGALIHYTLDGSVPDASSPICGDAGVLVDSSRTLNAIAIWAGYSSPVTTRTFTLQAQAVTIGRGGDGWPPFKIGMSSWTPGAVIRYAKGGTVPTPDSTVYVDSLPFGRYDDSTTYSAIAYSAHPNVVPSTPTTVRFGQVAPWNTSIAYGTMTDPRDGRIYRTVTIGTQTWMAENLNYQTDSSWCYYNAESICGHVGRLYQWPVAMGAATTYGGALLGASLPRQGACPVQWHVPSDLEWSRLVQYVDSSRSSRNLRSNGGWGANGIDTYGFRALPAGARLVGGVFVMPSIAAYFWSSTEVDASNARSRAIADSALIYRDKRNAFPLRCLKD